MDSLTIRALCPEPASIHVNILKSQLAIRYSEDIYTEWRGCIGCIDLQVSFRKRASNNKGVLRKVTYKDKASYASLPPCTVLALLNVSIHVCSILAGQPNVHIVLSLRARYIYCTVTVRNVYCTIAAECADTCL